MPPPPDPDCRCDIIGRQALNLFPQCFTCVFIFWLFPCISPPQLGQDVLFPFLTTGLLFWPWDVVLVPTSYSEVVLRSRPRAKPSISVAGNGRSGKPLEEGKTRPPILATKHPRRWVPNHTRRRQPDGRQKGVVCVCPTVLRGRIRNGHASPSYRPSFRPLRRLDASYTQTALPCDVLSVCAALSCGLPLGGHAQPTDRPTNSSKGQATHTHPCAPRISSGTKEKRAPHRIWDRDHASGPL